MGRAQRLLSSTRLPHNDIASKLGGEADHCLRHARGGNRRPFPNIAKRAPTPKAEREMGAPTQGAMARCDPFPAMAMPQNDTVEAKGSLEVDTKSPAVDWGESSPMVSSPTDERAMARALRCGRTGGADAQARNAWTSVLSVFGLSSWPSIEKRPEVVVERRASRCRLASFDTPLDQPPLRCEVEPCRLI